MSNGAAVRNTEAGCLRGKVPGEHCRVFGSGGGQMHVKKIYAGPTKNGYQKTSKNAISVHSGNIELLI